MDTIVVNNQTLTVIEKYNSNTYILEIDDRDYENLRVYAGVTGYIIEPVKDKSIVKIHAKDFWRHGWIRKFANVNNGETIIYYVYGFWSGSRYIVKHSLMPQLKNCLALITAMQKGQKIIIKARMKRIYIPDFEKNGEELKELWRKKK